MLQFAVPALMRALGAWRCAFELCDDAMLRNAMIDAQALIGGMRWHAVMYYYAITILCHVVPW